MEERMLLPKNERLFLRNDINKLFSSGQTFISYPLRIIYCNSDNDSSPGISMLISVPKKNIKQAVKRNRIKRLIRESFRLNKNDTSTLFIQKEKKLHIAFIYLCKDIIATISIEKAVQKALNIIRQKELVSCHAVNVDS